MIALSIAGPPGKQASLRDEPPDQAWHSDATSVPWSTSRAPPAGPPQPPRYVAHHSFSPGSLIVVRLETSLCRVEDKTTSKHSLSCSVKMSATLPFRDINVHASPSYYAFSSPSSPDAPTLVVDRPTGDIRLSESKITGGNRVSNIPGILGIIHLKLGMVESQG